MGQYWTEEETESLIRGYAKHGHKWNRWMAIKKDDEFSILQNRTNIQLKDKWRTLLGRHIEPDEEVVPVIEPDEEVVPLAIELGPVQVAPILAVEDVQQVVPGIGKEPVQVHEVAPRPVSDNLLDDIILEAINQINGQIDVESILLHLEKSQYATSSNTVEDVKKRLDNLATDGTLAPAKVPGGYVRSLLGSPSHTFGSMTAEESAVVRAEYEAERALKEAKEACAAVERATQEAERAMQEAERAMQEAEAATAFAKAARSAFLRSSKQLATSPDQRKEA